MNLGLVIGESFLIALGLITFLGNLSTILAFIVKRSLRSNPSYWYLASLAVADGLVGLFAFPASIYDEFHRDPDDKRMCDTIAYGVFFTVIPTYAHLTMVSVDRYFKLMSPLKYIKHMSVKKAKISLLIIWIFSFITACLFFFTEHTFDKSCIALIIGDGSQHEKSAWCFWIFLFCFQHLPVCLLVYLNYHIYRIATTVKKVVEQELTVTDPFQKVELRIHRGKVIIENPPSTSSETSTKITDQPSSPPGNLMSQFSSSSTALNMSVTSPLPLDHSVSAPSSPSGRETRRNFETTTRLFTFLSHNENHLTIQQEENKLSKQIARKKKRNLTASQAAIRQARSRKLCDWMVCSVKQRKISILVSVIVIAAAICWVPSSTIYMIKWYCKECTWSRDTWVTWMSPWPLYFNSTVNPFILLFMSEDFRKAYRQLYACIFRPGARKDFPI